MVKVRYHLGNNVIQKVKEDFMTEKEWKHRIAITLRQKMKEADITQVELARVSHLSQSVISKYLNEMAAPDIRSIINLSVALNCQVGDLADFGERVK